ncbi:hypothetical protein BS47DRAFT_1341990 [Hydnum rufescens UP504]|uniref:Uncharacterized protein n=1 Tax=Hydnum rufescens UP504 TaxID=1448309 RepID=A0A9P6DVG5_9AGAM|nr:hypothetical protein BS47DRAFT_1341990 [Hydnum rufescens UP504]
MTTSRILAALTETNAVLTKTNAELTKTNAELTKTNAEFMKINSSPTPKASQHTRNHAKDNIPTPSAPSAWRHSECLKPITPTGPAKKLFPARLPPQSPTCRNHPGRLNIQVSPPIPADKRLTANDAVISINRSLREAHAPNNITVMSVLYSMAGNPIAIARPPCSANDLQPYATLIAKAIFPPVEKAQGRPDSQYFRVKLDHVPLRRGDGTQITPTEVEDEIAMNVTEFPSFIRPLPTRWLIAADKIPQSNSASLVFTFTHEPEARRFFDAHTIFVLGEPCKTSRYEERTPKRDPKSASTQYNNNQAPHQPAPENGIEIDDQVWTPPHAERKRKLSENAEVRRQRPPPDT